MFKELWKDSIPHPYSFQTNGALFIGRLLVGIPLIPNALRKIETFAQTAAGMGGIPQVINGRPFPDQHPLIVFPQPELFLGLSLTFDMLGAILLIVGLKGRFVGALLAGYVLIALSIFHTDIRGPMDVQALLRNLPMLAALLMISGVGVGTWSLDGLLGRRPKTTV